MSAHEDGGNPCGDCNVVHVNFGQGDGQKARPQSDDSPLTSVEIRGLRQIFSHCPIAMRALLRGEQQL